MKNFDQPTCIQVEDVNITDHTAICNSFNDYFTSIADEILKNVNKKAQNHTEIFCRPGSLRI